MKENQKELEQLIRKVMDQMDERKYGKRYLHITIPVTSFLYPYHMI